MQIIEVNHKTAAKLLRKSVEEYWMDDNKDAYIRFTDGSVVCVHMLERTYAVVVSLRKQYDYQNSRFCDEQAIYWFNREDSDGAMITDRTVSLDFDHARYYYHRQFDLVTRQYIPVIEFHYYEKGEEVARND